jgi:hypothetical protein
MLWPSIPKVIEVPAIIPPPKIIERPITPMINLPAVASPPRPAKHASWLSRWQTDRRERALAGHYMNEERARRKRLYGALVEDAWFYMDRIISVTKRMPTLSYRYKQSERDFLDSAVSTLVFDDAVLLPEAIYLRVNTVSLPRGVSVAALCEEQTLFDMSMACHHEVLAEYTPEKGFWYIIDNANTRGIPVHVRVDEVWAMRGKTHDGMSIPFGIGKNKRPTWLSFSDKPSILIAGATGSGKSNNVNLILCTLIKFNRPERLKLALVDLKRGVELGQYENLPHLLRYKALDEKYDPDDDNESEAAVQTTLAEVGEVIDDDTIPGTPPEMAKAFVDRPKKVLGLLRAVYWEGQRRLVILRHNKCRDIGTYNWRHPKRAMPRLMVIVDELAQLKELSPAEEKKAKTILEQIAALYRAAGIGVVIATQRPDRTVITGGIKQNCVVRLAYKCSDVTSSILIIGNGKAASLSHAGRGVLDYDGHQAELQTPYIPDKIIAETIELVMRGEFQDVEIRRHDVTEDEIFRVGLEQFAGELPGREIHAWFAGKGRPIPRQEVYDIIKKFTNNELMIRGSLYRVLPAQGSRPPRLVVADDVVAPAAG